MNFITPEQIKEYVSKHPDGIAGMSKELSEMVNHFAELIVQEMCQVIDADCELQYSEGVITNLAGLNQARELIKKHFGVEE